MDRSLNFRWNKNIVRTKASAHASLLIIPTMHITKRNLKIHLHRQHIMQLMYSKYIIYLLAVGRDTPVSLSSITKSVPRSRAAPFWCTSPSSASVQLILILKHRVFQMQSMYCANYITDFQQHAVCKFKEKAMN